MKDPGLCGHHLDPYLPPVSSDTQNRGLHLAQASLGVQEVSPHFQLSSVGSSACFPLMVFVQNMQLVGEGQEVAQTPQQMIPGVWGWPGGRKARPVLLGSLMGLAPILAASLFSCVTLGGLLKLCGCFLSQSISLSAFSLEYYIVRGINEQIYTFPPLRCYPIIKTQ